MSQSFDASTQSLRGGGLVIVRPCSISIWIYPTALAASPVGPTFFCLFNAGGTSGAYGFVNVTISNAVIVVDGSRNVTSSNTLNVGAWNHVVMVFNGDTSRAVYVNNTKTTGIADTLTFDFTAATQSSFGRYYDGTTSGQVWNGYLSDAAFYSVALSDADVAALKAGASPFLVRPASLVNYYPLAGNLNPVNAPSTSALTNINSSPVSSINPRIYR